MSRILIVGDIPALSGKLSSLYELGHEVETVDTGQDALWHIEEPGCDIDVIVTAEQLADMDGFDLVRAVVRARLAPAMVLVGERSAPLVTVRTSPAAKSNAAEPDPVAQIVALLS